MELHGACVSKLNACTPRLRPVRPTLGLIDPEAGDPDSRMDAVSHLLHAIAHREGPWSSTGQSGAAPGTSTLPGRRGRNEWACLPTLPTVEHHGRRARP
jgi:hypothetical protein